MDPATGEVVGDDAATQAEGALKNLQAVLEAAGSSLAKVLKCNVYIVDIFSMITEDLYNAFIHSDGMHFNDDGHAFIAEQTWKFITDNQLIDYSIKAPSIRSLD